MMIIPQNVLKYLANQLGVSENELEVLSRAMAGEPLAAISEKLGVKPSALQKRLGEVYRKFGIAGAGPGKLAKLQQTLIARYQEYQEYQAKQSSEKGVPAPSPAPPVTDAEEWIGRTAELNQLEHWILEEGCRLIWVIGVGGVGKTALVSQLRRRLGSHFSWQEQTSLLNRSLIQIWQRITGESASLNVDLDFLTRHPGLIIFDEAESLETQPLSFWQQIGEGNHQSCCIVTSWQLPPDLETWCRDTPTVKVLQLFGLSLADAHTYLAPGVPGTFTPDLLTELIHSYGANPGLLALAMKRDEWRQENWGDLLKKNTLWIHRQILTTVPTEQLSELEINILLGLALNSQSLTWQSLADLVLTSETSEMLTALITDGWVQQVGEQDYRLGQSLQQAIIHPLLSRYYNEQGHQCYLRGDFQTACQQLEQAVRYQPQSSAALYNLGATYEQLQDWPKAMRCYQRLNPQENSQGVHAGLNNQARLYLLSGKVKDAIEQLIQLKKRVRVPEIQAAVAKNLGWAYWLQGNYAEAETQLLHSLELQPQQPAPHYLLAQVYQDQDRTAEAQTAWSEGLQADQKQRDSGERPWRLSELDLWWLEALKNLEQLQS